MLEDARDDLAEGERHDRQVVAAQPQRRGAEHHAPHRGERHRDEEHEEEVDVDARAASSRLVGRQDVDVRVGNCSDKPADDERADRVERDVAEVEQAGEADHDVQAQGHDHVGQRLDRRVLAGRRDVIAVEPVDDREDEPEIAHAHAAAGR